MSIINYLEDEYTVLSIDPGPSIGICAVGAGPGFSYMKMCGTAHWNASPKSAMNWVRDLLDAYYLPGASNVQLLCEKFTLTGGGVVPDLTALEVSGAVKVEHGRFGVTVREEIPEIVWPIPAHMRAITNAMVANYLAHNTRTVSHTIYSEHERDALKHALRFLISVGHKPTIEAVGIRKT